MPRTLRTVLAVVAGLVLGSIVNMALITFGGRIVAPPAGADVTTMEGLKASLHLFEPRHFVMPWLAHALGTLVAALVACRLAPAGAVVAACVVGGMFLAGGIANALMLPAPAWFIAADLLLAYAPPAWLGWMLARRMSSGAGAARAA